MQQVVDIIKDAIPPEKRGEGDEIEIPLDELDTFTLRKLQSFVEVRKCILLIYFTLSMLFFTVLKLEKLGMNHSTTV